jgi:hypothetical protein
MKDWHQGFACTMMDRSSRQAGLAGARNMEHLLDEAPTKRVFGLGHARDERHFLQGLGVSVCGSLVVLQGTRRRHLTRDGDSIMRLINIPVTGNSTDNAFYLYNCTTKGSMESLKTAKLC